MDWDIEMESKEIIIKTIFSNRVNEYNGRMDISNPFNVIQTPYLPTMIALDVTFIITGLDIKKSYYYEITITSEKEKTKIFDSKPQKMQYFNPYNTVVNAVLNNLKIEQKTSGKFKANIKILNMDKKMIVESGDFFLLLKSEK